MYVAARSSAGGAVSVDSWAVLLRKSTLVQLLSAICRRSVVVGDVSPAALYTLTTSLRPTLLLDEFEMARDARCRSLQQLLRNGSSQGQRVFRGPRAYAVFGPKVIASRYGVGDVALASRGLVVAMRPTIRDLPALILTCLRELRTDCNPNYSPFAWKTTRE